MLTLLQEKNELESPQGRVSLALLIFQDILVIPFLLLTPFLSGINILQALSLSSLAKSVVILALLFIFALFILPKLVNFLASTRKRELFLLGILVTCFGISGATYLAGLSFSIGAFIAGILLSRTDYHLQIISEIEPFKDLLLCVFFVSIGLMFNPLTFNIYFLGKAFTLAISAIILKSIIIFLVIKYLGYTWNISLLTAILLFQVGEFSFILAQEGLKYNLISTLDHQLLIIITIFSIVLTPLVYYFFSSKILSSKLSNLVSSTSTYKNHLIIVGFGPIGRNLALEARLNNIPYIVIELNPITVRQEKRKGPLIPNLMKNY